MHDATASAEIALTRAITESAQSRLAMISGAREDNLHEDYYLSGRPQAAKAARR
jgi:ribosomal protein S12 methylthiotransferase accessory factor YcaO